MPVRLLLASLLLLSCAKRSPKESAPATAEVPAIKDAVAASPAPAQVRKIIRTGTLRLRVESYESVRQEVESLVTAAGGFVGSTHVQHDGGRVAAAELTLRIPSASFPPLVYRLSQLGRVLEEGTNAEDVTAAWVDLEARLKNARQMEARLLEIVAKGPDKVADLLEVERELGRVRGEIEAHEGQMRVMKDQVELGTLTLGLYTDEEHVPPSVGSRAMGTLRGSWRAFVGFGEGLLMVTLALLPWLPLIALAAWLMRRLWRRARRAVRVPA